jgi:murein L,D-transpeptidase YcbB/YkuD
VNAGHTYSRKDGRQKGELVDRVDPALVSKMPRSFRDSLPPLLARLSAPNAVLKPAPEYNFQDVEDWLNIDPDVRQCLIGVMVRGAQETLQRKGFDVGPIDGVLGPRTQAALRDFQQQQGINRSGQIDQETLKALNSAYRP